MVIKSTDVETKKTVTEVVDDDAVAAGQVAKNNQPVASPAKPADEPGKVRSPQFDAPGAPTPHAESMKHQFTPDAPEEGDDRG